MRLDSEVNSAKKGVKTHLSTHGLWSRPRAVAAVVSTSGVLLISSISLGAQICDPAVNPVAGISQKRLPNASNPEVARRLELPTVSAAPSDDQISHLEQQPQEIQDSSNLKDRMTIQKLVRSETSGLPQENQCKPPEKETSSHAEASDAKVTLESSGQPPRGPTVSTLDGKITVDPGEASLRDVIKAIQMHTGIEVEYPSGNMEDRVFGLIGPASLREVLVTLLYGSGLNYIIQTSRTDTNEIHSLVLSSQTSKSSAPPLQASVQAAREPKPASALYGGAGFSEEAEAGVVHAEPAAPPPTPAAEIPGVPQGFNLKQAAAASNKTTGQLLDEMQKRQLEILDAQAPPPQ